jgi:hypothetical protein
MPWICGVRSGPAGSWSPVVGSSAVIDAHGAVFYWYAGWLSTGGQRWRRGAARLDLPVPAPSHDLARETRVRV